jgi:hypothetical protein
VVTNTRQVQRDGFSLLVPDRFVDVAPDHGPVRFAVDPTGATNVSSYSMVSPMVDELAVELNAGRIQVDLQSRGAAAVVAPAAEEVRARLPNAFTVTTRSSRDGSATSAITFEVRSGWLGVVQVDHAGVTVDDYDIGAQVVASVRLEQSSSDSHA